MSRSDLETLCDWLATFAAAVRRVDYAAAGTMFDPDVYSFGTVHNDVIGLECLMARQWRSVWGVTRDFDFDYDNARGWISGDVGWIAARWRSAGERDGCTFDRTGRATIILRLHQNRWLAVHSHFSMDPSSQPPCI